MEKPSFVERHPFALWATLGAVLVTGAIAKGGSELGVDPCNVELSSPATWVSGPACEVNRLVEHLKEAPRPGDPRPGY